MYYSKTTGCTYLPAIHGDAMPADVVPISAKTYHEVLACPAEGKVRGHDAQGRPILIDPPLYVPTVEEFCARIDSSADRARRAVVGDPLRVLEYERAGSEARAFVEAGYPANEVPRSVAAWAVNGRSADQAADSIIAKAAAYNEMLYLLRETRLFAKENIRSAMAEGDSSKAEKIASEAVATFEAVVLRQSQR